MLHHHCVISVAHRYHIIKYGVVTVHPIYLMHIAKSVIRSFPATRKRAVSMKGLLSTVVSVVLVTTTIKRRVASIIERHVVSVVAQQTITRDVPIIDIRLYI